MFNKKNKANPVEAQLSLAQQAQQALKPTPLPDPEDPDIMDAIKEDQRAAMKRMGVRKTLLTGEPTPLGRRKTVAEGAY